MQHLCRNLSGLRSCCKAAVVAIFSFILSFFNCEIKITSFWVSCSKVKTQICFGFKFQPALLHHVLWIHDDFFSEYWQQCRENRLRFNNIFAKCKCIFRGRRSTWNHYTLEVSFTLFIFLCCPWIIKVNQWVPRLHSLIHSAGNQGESISVEGRPDFQKVSCAQMGV